ncbi:Rad2 nuclease [Orbilia blumenaviensis]|uniref:Rad2 nuclease n=1 Tax=Orbilia blumenaviensis TaxID=1796055 RepID=A0AAV9UYH5_9PEZI
MGINGLLPFLKSIQQPTHIKNWTGKRVAVDAYGWLHRGTISCAVDLALEKPTTKYVDYAMHRVRMLQHYGVTPYLVFDGDYLPGKKRTELDREKRRKSSRETGLELLRLGRTSQAHAELQKSIDVTPLMARRLIEELKKADIPYVVAPYEADAQMAYLERIGEVSAILSEDSDLLVFGAKCLLTKLDQYGECIAIHRADFAKVSEACMTGWSDSEFCRMAILSGCDYLVNIPKMGIKTAYRYVRKYKSADKIIRAIRMDGSFVVPASYEKSFVTAEMTFRYQRVYCPISRQLISCNGDMTLPDGIEAEQALNFGSIYDSKVAHKVASGDLDPMTKLDLRLDQVSMPASSKARVPATSAPSFKCTSHLNSLQKKERITSFFAPRTALAELGPRSVLSPRQSPIISNAPKNDMVQSTSLERGNKRRRLCMDVDNDATLSTEQSPFFTRSLKPTKKLIKHTVTTSRNPNNLQKGRGGGFPNRLDSDSLPQSPRLGVARVIHPRNQVPKKDQQGVKSQETQSLKMASLASFRFQKGTAISGSNSVHPAADLNNMNKENEAPTCSDQ